MRGEYGYIEIGRMARDPKTGKSEPVENLTYEDWYKKYVDSENFEEKGYNKNIEYVHKRLDFIDEYTNEKSFIPKGSEFKNTKIIAKDKEIRVLKRLKKNYSSKGSWEKKVGKIESAKYIYDVHWYENNKKQYEVKFKYRKEK